MAGRRGQKVAKDTRFPRAKVRLSKSRGLKVTIQKPLQAQGRAPTRRKGG